MIRSTHRALRARQTSTSSRRMLRHAGLVAVALLGASACVESETSDESGHERNGALEAEVQGKVDCDPTTPTTCDPKDQTPPAKIIQYNGKDSPLWENGAKWYEPSAVTNTDTPNTGPYGITIEIDPTAPTFTIYRPQVKDRLLPIVAFANGGCFQDGTMMGEFLKEIATHGFLVIADGAPNGWSISPGDGKRQKAMLDWALKENERPCSTYYHTLNTKKIAVAGNSCGGLMTFDAAPDPRVTTAVLFSSGLFQRNQKLYDSLHAPMAIFCGGPEDPASANGRADAAAITKVPVFYANDKRGHAGYYWDDNGGEVAKVGVAWFNWHLLGDTGATGKGTFVGPECGMCQNKKVWTDTAWKNVELLKN